MFRFVFIFVLVILFSNEVQSSDSLQFQNKNSIQFEIGGNGLLYSLVYERVLLNGNRFKTTAQAGIAYYPPKTGMRDLWIPLLVNELLSFNKHHIELGLGYIFIYEASRDLENNPSNWKWNGVFTGRLGYRYQKPNGRLIIRAAFTPFLEGPPFNYYEFHPSGGAAIGYSF